jgi:hypothetical protein
MPFAETPVQIIKGSINLFELAWFVGDAVQEGQITPASFREDIRLHDGAWTVVLNNKYTAEELTADAAKLILITLGTTAMSTNKALEVVYGKDFDPADTSPEGTARALLYQIRCAFAHDPLNPVWTPNPQKYNHRYRVTVQVNRQTREPVIRKIEFHPPEVTPVFWTGRDAKIVVQRPSQKTGRDTWLRSGKHMRRSSKRGWQWRQSKGCGR